jgi:hypothetical protein
VAKPAKATPTAQQGKAPPRWEKKEVIKWWPSGKRGLGGSRVAEAVFRIASGVFRGSTIGNLDGEQRCCNFFTTIMPGNCRNFGSLGENVNFSLAKP